MLRGGFLFLVGEAARETHPGLLLRINLSRDVVCSGFDPCLEAVIVVVVDVVVGGSGEGVGVVWW